MVCALVWVGAPGRGSALCSWARYFTLIVPLSTQVSSSETQGQLVGARESRNGRKKISAKKSKVRNEEPLGTQSYRTSSKRSESFWLLIGATKPLFFCAQSESSKIRSRFVCSYTD